MKKVILSILIMMGIATNAVSQCKPDGKDKDRITKQERVFWGVEIVKRTLGNKILFDKNTTFPSVTALVGKQGDKFFIRFNLVVTQKSAGSAAFNAPFRGSKESTILLGFVEGGEPLLLRFDEVSNDQIVDYDKNYVYSTSFTQYYSIEEIGKFKEILTSKTVDIIELNLEGGKKMQDKVRDKNGEKLLNKFVCFYDYIANE